MSGNRGGAWVNAGDQEAFLMKPLAVPVHISAWADHHIKAARVSVKSLPTLRVASPRNGETAYLRTGYLGLGGVTSPSLL